MAAPMRNGASGDVNEDAHRSSRGHPWFLDPFRPGGCRRPGGRLQSRPARGRRGFRRGRAAHEGREGQGATGRGGPGGESATLRGRRVDGRRPPRGDDEQLQAPAEIPQAGLRRPLDGLGPAGAAEPAPGAHLVTQGDTLWALASSTSGNPTSGRRSGKTTPTSSDAHWIYPGRPARDRDPRGRADRGLSEHDVGAPTY